MEGTSHAMVVPAEDDSAPGGAAASPWFPERPGLHLGMGVNAPAGPGVVHPHEPFLAAVEDDLPAPESLPQTDPAAHGPRSVGGSPRVGGSMMG